jgi:hypothetical protein
VKAALDAHKAEVGTLKSEQKTVEQKAKEQLRSFGVPAGQLPPNSDKPEGTDTYAQALEAYGKITDPVKAAAFYASNIQPFVDGSKK